MMPMVMLLLMAIAIMIMMSGDDGPCDDGDVVIDDDDCSGDDGVDAVGKHDCDDACDHGD